MTKSEQLVDILESLRDGEIDVDIAAGAIMATVSEGVTDVREPRPLNTRVSNHSADTDEYEIAATMIVRPLLTIEAESPEQAVEKLMASEFDTKEMAETAKPVSGIEAVEIYKNGKRLPDPQY